MRAAASVLIVVAFMRPVRAHPLDVGSLRIEGDGDQIAVRLDLDVNAAAIVLGIAPATIDAATVRASAAALADRTYARSPITNAAGPCRWTAAVATLSGRTVEISSTAECTGPGARRWAFPVVSEGVISPRFQLMVDEQVAGSEQLSLVDKATRAIDLRYAPAPVISFDELVWSGIEHVGVAPARGGFRLPEGVDHILVLLALALAGGTVLQLVKIATGFALGSAITLAFVGLGGWQPPVSVIEPLIAFSIAVAAVSAFSDKLTVHRWKLATGFGLVHGFGFATRAPSGVRATVTALVGYGLGIAIGAIVVVLLVEPLLVLARRHVRGGAIAIRVVASVIVVYGLYAVYERAS